MLIKNRAPGIESGPAYTQAGLDHLKDEWVAVLRWLAANQVEHVLVGPVAGAIRGRAGAQGPVAIVPAPYGRNLERLSRALGSAHARLRIDGQADAAQLKVTAEMLARGSRWTLRCDAHDLDIEGWEPGVPRYQELLYEAQRFYLVAGLNVEVAAPEDLEHFASVPPMPEIRVTRTQPAEPRKTNED